MSTPYWLTLFPCFNFSLHISSLWVSLFLLDFKFLLFSDLSLPLCSLGCECSLLTSLPYSDLSLPLCSLASKFPPWLQFFLFPDLSLYLCPSVSDHPLLAHILSMSWFVPPFMFLVCEFSFHAYALFCVLTYPSFCTLVGECLLHTCILSVSWLVIQSVSPPYSLTCFLYLDLTLPLYSPVCECPSFIAMLPAPNLSFSLFSLDCESFRLLPSHIVSTF